MRRNRPRISHAGISLVIEELYAEVGINRRLIRVGQRPGYLIQAEPRE